LKLSAEASEDLTNEEGNTSAPLVEKQYVEAAKKVVDFTKQLQQTAVEEVGEILKARMKVKRLPQMLVPPHQVMLFKPLSQNPLILTHLHPHTTLNT